MVPQNQVQKGTKIFFFNILSMYLNTTENRNMKEWFKNYNLQYFFSKLTFCGMLYSDF
jgi:hypothetical protein